MFRLIRDAASAPVISSAVRHETSLEVFFAVTETEAAASAIFGGLPTVPVP
jgi:hypothetical protein